MHFSEWFEYHFIDPSSSFTAVLNRKLHWRLAYCYHMAKNCSNVHRDGHLPGASYSRRCHHRMEHLYPQHAHSIKEDRAHRYRVGFANVPPLIPHIPSHASPFQTLYWCQLKEHWRSEQNQLQHSLRSENVDDHLSGDGPVGLHPISVDHLKLAHAGMREVRIWTFLYPSPNSVFKIMHQRMILNRVPFKL